MKKIGLLRSFIVVGLSIILIISLTSKVFAADDTWDSAWESPDSESGVVEITESAVDAEPTPTEETSELDNTTITLPVEVENNTDNTNSSATTVNANNSSNTDGNVNALVYTGSEDNSVMALLVVLGITVAAISLKKFKDYKDL